MLETGVRLTDHDKGIVSFPTKEYTPLIMSKLTLLHWQLYTESLTGIIKN